MNFKSCVQLYESGKYRDALEGFLECLNRGETAPIHNYLGKTYLALDQKEASHFAFSKAYELATTERHPDLVEFALDFLNSLDRQPHSPENDEILLKTCMQFKDSDSRHALIVADKIFEQGNYIRATEIYNTLYGKMPQSSEEKYRCRLKEASAYFFAASNLESTDIVKKKLYNDRVIQYVEELRAKEADKKTGTSSNRFKIEFLIFQGQAFDEKDHFVAAFNISISQANDHLNLINSAENIIEDIARSYSSLASYYLKKGDIRELKKISSNLARNSLILGYDTAGEIRMAITKTFIALSGEQLSAEDRSDIEKILEEFSSKASGIKTLETLLEYSKNSKTSEPELLEKFLREKVDPKNALYFALKIRSTLVGLNTEKALELFNIAAQQKRELGYSASDLKQEIISIVSGEEPRALTEKARFSARFQSEVEDIFYYLESIILEESLKKLERINIVEPRKTLPEGKKAIAVEDLFYKENLKYRWQSKLPCYIECGANDQFLYAGKDATAQDLMNLYNLIKVYRAAEFARKGFAHEIRNHISAIGKLNSDEKKFPHRSKIALYYQKIASSYIIMGDPDLAQSYAEASIELIRELKPTINNPESIKTLDATLYDSLITLGNLLADKLDAKILEDAKAIFLEAKGLATMLGYDLTFATNREEYIEKQISEFNTANELAENILQQKDLGDHKQIPTLDPLKNPKVLRILYARLGREHDQESKTMRREISRSLMHNQDLSQQPQTLATIDDEEENQNGFQDDASSSPAKAATGDIASPARDDGQDSLPDSTKAESLSPGPSQTTEDDEGLYPTRHRLNTADVSAVTARVLAMLREKNSVEEKSLSVLRQISEQDPKKRDFIDSFLMNMNSLHTAYSAAHSGIFPINAGSKCASVLKASSYLANLVPVVGSFLSDTLSAGAEKAEEFQAAKDGVKRDAVVSNAWGIWDINQFTQFSRIIVAKLCDMSYVLNSLDDEKEESMIKFLSKNSNGASGLIKRLVESGKSAATISGEVFASRIIETIKDRVDYISAKVQAKNKEGMKDSERIQIAADVVFEAFKAKYNIKDSHNIKDSQSASAAPAPAAPPSTAVSPQKGIGEAASTLKLGDAQGIKTSTA